MDSIFVDLGVSWGWAMELISYAIFTVLLVVSLIHLGWAFGMAWPAQRREMLIATVVGLPKGKPMPPAALTVMVAFAIAFLGVVALWGAGILDLPVFTALKGWALLGDATIFGLRGVITYLPSGPFNRSAEPFKTLNQRYFSPLCLLLSVGYVAIFLSL